MSDHTGARMLLEKLPSGSILIGDRGYDSDDFRTALNARGIKVCIPPTKNRKQPIDYDKALYKWRHKIENMFGRLKDWRRIAMRYAAVPIPSSPQFVLPPLSFFICSQ